MTKIADYVATLDLPLSASVQARCLTMAEGVRLADGAVLRT